MLNLYLKSEEKLFCLKKINFIHKKNCHMPYCSPLYYYSNNPLHFVNFKTRVEIINLLSHKKKLQELKTNGYKIYADIIIT